MDVEGLDKQIAEKRQVEEKERERQKQFDKEDQRRATVLDRKNQELREVNWQNNIYRIQFYRL